MAVMGDYNGSAMDSPSERRIIPAGQRWGYTQERPWPWYTSQKGNLYTRHSGRVAIVFSIFPEQQRPDDLYIWTFLIKAEGIPDLRGERYETQAIAQATAMRALGLGGRTVEVKAEPPPVHPLTPLDEDKLIRRIRL